MIDNVIVGTGCHKNNHITRVYIKPQYQGKGYGSYIMQCLEDEIARNYGKTRPLETVKNMQYNLQE